MEYMSIEELLNIISGDHCLKCGSKRKGIQFKDLPETSKSGFKMLMSFKPYKKGASFHYCK
jgi:hypothetical protein